MTEPLLALLSLCTSIPRVDRCLWCHGMLVVHDAKIETRRLEAIIESTCEGPREKRPKYKDLALQQPPKNFALFLLRYVQRFQVSPKVLLIPFPLLPPSSNPSITRINLYNIHLIRWPGCHLHDYTQNQTIRSVIRIDPDRYNNTNLIFDLLKRT
ncbi:Uncharacterized protein HZ326_20612 [Fusarium oxysporum f. sp. albedinis]|nr:Uncharacterized protein HZ326_20612 [Fusarium oxysporum f. sp. albedinis]